MDRLEAMTIFVKVADRGSFSSASRDLGIPLATVSRKVSELERHLGARLLVRTTRKVSLTDVGSTYLASVRRIVDELDEAERIAAGELEMARGELLLTAPLLFGRMHVLPIVNELLAAYPQINVRLLLSDRNLQLIEDHIDMAVRIGPLPDSSMVATRVGSMRTVICAAPTLLATHGTPTSPAQLGTLPAVNFELMSPTAMWPFRREGQTSMRHVEVRPRLSVTAAEAAVSAARAGVGVTRVLHYQCADAVREGALKIILAEFEVEPLPVHVLHAGRAALPAKVRLFLDFATARLKASLRALGA